MSRIPSSRNSPRAASTLAGLAPSDRVGAHLRAIRELTSDFTLPPEACNTVRALFDGLENLEHEMHDHVHLENEILFPRALELERALFGRSEAS
jgi:iron-sulfur cluster repair protein YtfE (RIC family)